MKILHELMAGCQRLLCKLDRQLVSQCGQVFLWGKKNVSLKTRRTRTLVNQPSNLVFSYRFFMSFMSVIIGQYSPRRSRGEYSPIITEPEANNCFSISTQVIISKRREKNISTRKSSSLTVAKRLLAAILSV